MSKKHACTNTCYMVTPKSKGKSTHATICCTPVYRTHLMTKSRLIQSNQHTIHSQEEPRENKESTGHHSLQQKTVKHTQELIGKRAMAEGMSVFMRSCYGKTQPIACTAQRCLSLDNPILKAHVSCSRRQTEVARVGRPATVYVLLVRLWKSSIQPFHTAFPRSTNTHKYYLHQTLKLHTKNAFHDRGQPSTTDIAQSPKLVNLNLFAGNKTFHHQR